MKTVYRSLEFRRRGIGMFESLGRIDYTDTLQCAETFSVSHINYGKAPVFNEVNGRHCK